MVFNFRPLEMHEIYIHKIEISVSIVWCTADMAYQTFNSIIDAGRNCQLDQWSFAANYCFSS